MKLTGEQVLLPFKVDWKSNAVGDLSSKTVKNGGVFGYSFVPSDLEIPAVESGGIFDVEVSAGFVVGDTNLDQAVDLSDLNNVRNNFGGTGLGDTDFNGTVDLADLNNVRNNFGVNSTVVVAEPSTALLLSIAVAVLIPRRRSL